MHEQIARPLYYVGVHLLCASTVWFATSLNFMLPLGALLDKLLARHLTWASPLPFIGGVGLRIAEDTGLAYALGAVWMLGAALMFTRLCVRLRAERPARQRLEYQGVDDDKRTAFFFQ